MYPARSETPLSTPNADLAEAVLIMDDRSRPDEQRHFHVDGLPDAFQSFKAVDQSSGRPVVVARILRELAIHANQHRRGRNFLIKGKRLPGMEATQEALRKRVETLLMISGDEVLDKSFRMLGSTSSIIWAVCFARSTSRLVLGRFGVCDFTFGGRLRCVEYAKK